MYIAYEMKFLIVLLISTRFIAFLYRSIVFSQDKVAVLMADEDVIKKSGIYEYVFDGKEKHLNIREFTLSDKRTVYEKQKGICPLCGEYFECVEMHADHIKPWSKGGRTEKDNC